MKESKYSGITREDIIRAIDIYNNSDSKVKIKNYVLVYEGNEYPSKEIIRIAYNLKNNSNITSNDLSGGKQWISFYEDRGFEIKVVNKEINEDTPQQTVKNETAWDRLQKLKEKIERESDGENNIIKAKYDNRKTVTQSDNNFKNSDKTIKIATYVQSNSFKNSAEFSKIIPIIKNNEFDIFVLPELCWVPIKPIISNLNIFEPTDLIILEEKTLELSRSLGKAIVFGNEDIHHTIFSVFANAFAKENETKFKLYIKHTKTGRSAFDHPNFIALEEDNFKPIIYKNYKIGLTVCFDSLFPVFSKAYGKIDIIINCTGGDVNLSKWYRFNKIRSIENNCFTILTMGSEEKNNHNYSFGITPKGFEMKSNKIYSPTNKFEKKPPYHENGAIYLYNLVDNGDYQVDRDIKDGNYIYDKKEAKSIIVSSTGNIINSGSFSMKKIIINGINIYNPIHYLRNTMSNTKNERFILVVKFESLSKEEFECIISDLLKEIAAIQHCGVILISPEYNNAYQGTNYKSASTLALNAGGNYSFNSDMIKGIEKELDINNYRNGYKWLIDNKL